LHCMASARPVQVVADDITGLLFYGRQELGAADGLVAIAERERRQAAEVGPKRDSLEVVLLRKVFVGVEAKAVRTQMVEAKAQLINQLGPENVDFARRQTAGIVLAIAVWKPPPSSTVWNGEGRKLLELPKLKRAKKLSFWLNAWSTRISNLSSVSLRFGSEKKFPPELRDAGRLGVGPGRFPLAIRFVATASNWRFGFPGYGPMTLVGTPPTTGEAGVPQSPLGFVAEVPACRASNISP